MKPDWEDAPDWANWLAASKTADGEVLYMWFENKPRFMHDIEAWDADGRQQFTYTFTAEVPEDFFMFSLSKRPQS